jgi:hypothetical protein
MLIVVVWGWHFRELYFLWWLNFDLLVTLAANMHGQSDGKKKKWRNIAGEGGDCGEIEESRRIVG